MKQGKLHEDSSILRGGGELGVHFCVAEIINFNTKLLIVLSALLRVEQIFLKNKE
jgi:hypothetical protein